MRAVVTGGAGFIGSHVAAALAARGDEVHVLDNLSTGRREFVPEGVRLHVGDIRRDDDLDLVFDEARPEVCFHLAAQADVGTSVAEPVYDAEVNVLGTLRVRRGGAPARGAGRVQLHRRRDLRRVRRAGGRGCAAAAAVAVRHREARRRGVPRDLEPPAWHGSCGASLRQRLRAAPGGGPRGRRGRDLPRADGGGRDEHDLRRRLADPRLRLRRRRRAGRAGRGRPRRRRLQRRHRGRAVGVGALRGVLPCRRLRPPGGARAGPPGGPAAERARPRSRRRASSAGAPRRASRPGSPRPGAGSGSSSGEGAAPRREKSPGTMEHSLPSPVSVGPWRTATIVVVILALLELAALVAAGAALFGPSVAHSVQHAAAQQVFAPIKAVPIKHQPKPGPPTLSRSQTSILVLNGNGRAGAAAAAAARVRRLGYTVRGAANAPHTGYVRSIVMFRPGLRVGGAAPRARPARADRLAARRHPPAPAARREARVRARRAARAGTATSRCLTPGHDCFGRMVSSGSMAGGRSQTRDLAAADTAERLTPPPPF